MNLKSKPLVFFLASIFAVWLFASIWNLAGPMDSNIVNAAEAGVPDTVSASSWFWLAVMSLLLAGDVTLLWWLGPRRFKGIISTSQSILIIAIPICLTALVPLIWGLAAYAIFASIAIGLVTRTISLERKTFRTTLARRL
jgi:hypothetical protein